MTAVERQQLGNELRTLRKQNFMTQPDVAELMGVCRQTVSRIENGEPMALKTQLKLRFILDNLRRPAEGSQVSIFGTDALKRIIGISDDCNDVAGAVEYLAMRIDKVPDHALAEAGRFFEECADAPGEHRVASFLAAALIFREQKRREMK